MNSRTSWIPADQKARNLAIQNHESCLTIEAGAGTGKTSLLVARYLSLVSQQVFRPTQIVAITFTEKAASELRSRIREQLTTLHQEKALEEFDRATISTIHSFAASLLRERPFEAGVDPNFEQLDALAANLFLQRSYDHWFQKALSSSVLSKALSAGLSLSQIRRLALELYAYRDLLPSLSPPPSPIDVKKFFSSFLNQVDSLKILADRDCLQLEDEGFQAIQKLWIEATTVAELPLQTQIRSLFFRCRAPAKGNQKNWRNPQACKQQKETMKALSEELRMITQQLRQGLFYELLIWVTTFTDFVDQEKRKAGVLDFDDLLFLARDLLKSNSEVRRYFQKRFGCFLIDEFQDTDPIQAELLWYLASEGTSRPNWVDLPLTPGKLVLVGDPKQSIYRFRRASIETYRVLSHSISQQGQGLKINQNFRSSKPLIDWTNQVFSPILGQDYEPLIADETHLSSPSQRPIYLLEPPLDLEPGSAQQTRELEAQAISAFLHKLLEEAPSIVFDRSQGTMRPIRAGDIAILFPTMTGVDLFEEYLRAYGLSFSLEGGNLFFQRSEVHGLISTLEAIVHPTDFIKVVAAFRSVLFGFSDSDLFQIFSEKISFDYRLTLPSHLPEPIPTGYRILQELHSSYQDQSPSEIIQQVLYATLAIPHALRRYHGEQAAANFEQFLDLARHQEQQGFSTLPQFLQWVKTRTEGSDQRTESLTTDPQAERIHLLTIHKSKGLEFPLVVVANLSTSGESTESILADRLSQIFAVGMGPKETRFSTSNYEDLLEKEKTIRQQEKKRLLYVAVTRARDSLVFPRFLPARKRPEAFWTLLEEGFEKGESFLQRIPWKELPIQSLSELRRHNDIESPSSPFLFIQREKEIYQQTLNRENCFIPGLPLQTPTSLVHESKEISPNPIPIFEGDGKAQLLGLGLHQVLEKIDLVSPFPIEPLCETVCFNLGCPEHFSELVRLSQQALASPIWDRIRKAKNVYREVPFSWMEGTSLFEGVIDLVWEESAGLVILDYKTDRIEKNQLGERSRFYAPQLLLYQKAVQDLTQKPVVETLLFFIRLSQTLSL